MLINVIETLWNSEDIARLKRCGDWHTVLSPICIHRFLCLTYDKSLCIPWKNHRFHFPTELNICPSCHLLCCKNDCVTGEETNVTHWDRNNMAAILQTTFQIDFPKVCVFIQISLKFIHNGPVCNLLSLVQTMACSLCGDKPLPEPMLI